MAYSMNYKYQNSKMNNLYNRYSNNKHTKNVTLSGHNKYGRFGSPCLTSDAYNCRHFLQVFLFRAPCGEGRRAKNEVL